MRTKTARPVKPCAGFLEKTVHAKVPVAAICLSADSAVAEKVPDINCRLCQHAPCLVDIMPAGHQLQLLFCQGPRENWCVDTICPEVSTELEVEQRDFSSRTLSERPCIR